MSELRQDPATKEWVIIATERAKRPDQFRRRTEAPDLPVYDPACPFCPGREALTPPTLWEKKAAQVEGGADWRVRVFANKFPALTPAGETQRRTRDGFFQQMDGLGYHEVIVETPIHNRCIHQMENTEVQDVLEAYRERYVALRQDRHVKMILIFKNHGESAGTSLAHPHSQIVATPVVPGRVRRKYEEGVRYFDATGRCLYSDWRDAEQAAAHRVVLETDRFLVFHPFASRSPFETWILPKRQCPSFGRIEDDEVGELACVLGQVLSALARLLNRPDYNYVVHSAPVDGEDEEYFLWHVQIVPRLIRTAGFEIGSGMRINTACPEETAGALRESLERGGAIIPA